MIEPRPDVHIDRTSVPVEMFTEVSGLFDPTRRLCTARQHFVLHRLRHRKPHGAHQRHFLLGHADFFIDRDLQDRCAVINTADEDRAFNEVVGQLLALPRLRQGHGQ